MRGVLRKKCSGNPRGLPELLSYSGCMALRVVSVMAPSKMRVA